MLSRQRRSPPCWTNAACLIAGSEFQRQAHGLSTTMARKSVTLVNVGPGANKSPMPLKNPVELLSARNAAGSRPAARARASVVGSMKAPAGSSGRPRPPSVPSVSAASAAMPVAPSRWMASARAYSWFGPPLALAAQRHGQFAARKDDRAAALRLQVAGEPGVLGRDLARLALQPVAEHHAFVAGRVGAGLRGAQRIGRPRDDPVGCCRRKASSPGFGDSFVGSASARGHGFRQIEPVAGARSRGRRQAWSGPARSGPSRSPPDRRPARRRSPASPPRRDGRAGRAGRP